MGHVDGHYPTAAFRPQLTCIVRVKVSCRGSQTDAPWESWLI